MLLVLLVCAVEAKPEIVAVRRSSVDDFFSMKTTSRQVEYLVESLTSNEVALKARILTRLNIPKVLGETDSSDSHL